MPATGGWQAWTTVSFTATLGAGVQQMTLYADTAGYNIDSVTINSAGGGGVVSAPAPSGLSPYWGSPASVPGTIQAEDFDNGGNFVD